MRSCGIEVNAPLLNQYLGVTEAVEQLSIEELISELAVKALAVAVLPWATWRDVCRLGPQALQPVPQHGRYKLWPYTS